MRRLLLAPAAMAAMAIAAPLALSSSHREAPGISLDPSADNTDTYAWTAKDAPGALTVAANWIPGEVPANGPNFHSFDDRARYYVHIDNTGDGRPDVSYRFKFRTKIRNRESFLYALPGASGFGDPKLNVIQRYSVVRETHRYGRGGPRVRERTLARGLPVAPPNIGPKTLPNYDAFVAGAIRGLRDGTKVFVGQRDDPFFVDLGATFDGLNVRELTGNKGEGKDDLSGYNVHSVVLQLPERLVTKDHRAVTSQDAANAVVGVWSTTERRRLQVTGSARARGRWVQVSRLGNPLVNEVVIPLGQKDIVQALLQGIPDLNQHPGIEGPPAVDTIKLNLGVPPADAEDRFGVIGGDVAGYPNGRRLGDDVVDIDLQVVAGFLKDNKVPLGDGVDQNDKPFLPAFPYLAAPASGFDSAPSARTEPGHAPVPAGG